MNGAIGSLVWAMALLIAVLAVGVLAIYAAGRLRSWVNEGSAYESELLERFRELYESGELTAEEFRRVRKRLSRR